MEFGKSATNFDCPPSEQCPNGRRNAEAAETFIFKVKTLDNLRKRLEEVFLS